MRVLPINNYQNSYNYQRTNCDYKHAAPVAFGHSANPGAARRVGMGVMGILCALSMAAMSLFNSSCKKIDEPVTPDPVVPDDPTPDNPIVGDTTNWDLVDFAFRDLVGTFGLDTVGKTKTLQMSYPFNEGDYMVDNFEPQTKQDTMYANGVYHYTGPDESIPRETPYRVMWTRVPMDDQQYMVRLEYDYGAKDAAYWPKPQVIDIEPGSKGDNAITMAASGPAGSLMNGFAAITGSNAECTVYAETVHSFSNPFNVNITANYPNNKK